MWGCVWGYEKVWESVLGCGERCGEMWEYGGGVRNCVGV